MPTLVDRLSDRTCGEWIGIVRKRSRYFSWSSWGRPPVSRPKISTTSCPAERSVPQIERRLCREEVRLAQCRQFGLERVPAWPHAQVDVLPVVEAGALHFASRRARSPAARSGAALRRRRGRSGRRCRCSSESLDGPGRRASRCALAAVAAARSLLRKQPVRKLRAPRTPRPHVVTDVGIFRVLDAGSPPPSAQRPTRGIPPRARRRPGLRETPKSRTWRAARTRCTFPPPHSGTAAANTFGRLLTRSHVPRPPSD